MQARKLESDGIWDLLDTASFCKKILQQIARILI